MISILFPQKISPQKIQSMQPQNPHPETINLNKLYGKSDNQHCGYCSKYGSCTWSFTQQKFHAHNYMQLMQRGWRRSGDYYYKPDLVKSCCKLWTHRMDVEEFVVKRDQRRTVGRVMEWLGEAVGEMLGETAKQGKQQGEKAEQGKSSGQKGKEQETKQINKSNENKKQESKQKINLEIPQKFTQASEKVASYLQHFIHTHRAQFLSLFSTHLIAENQQHPQFIHQIDRTKLKCFLSKPEEKSDFYNNFIMLLFGMNKNSFKKQYKSVDFVRDTADYLEKHLNQNWRQQVVLKIERSGFLLFTFCDSPKIEKILKASSEAKNQEKKQKSEEQLKKNDKKQQRDKKAQEKSEHEPDNRKQRFQIKITSKQITIGPLRIIIVPAQVTAQSTELYSRYSKQIHDKQQAKSSYKSFLCTKALNFAHQQCPQLPIKPYTPAWAPFSAPVPITSPATKLLGSYHMKYYLKNQLIGVGVVDLLPHGLSSVYFFYQPKYKDQRLGVFSSLVQIQYIRWLSLSFPEYKYYYMGFYIQNCTKMSYKGNYQPFHLLCPITYNFVPCNNTMRGIIDKIEKKQIESVKLDQEGTKLADMDVKAQEVMVYLDTKTKIKYQGQNLRMRDLNKQYMPIIIGLLRAYLELWGKQLYESFVFTF